MSGSIYRCICMQSRRFELSSRQLLLNVTLPRRRGHSRGHAPAARDLYKERSPLARICQNLPSPKRHQQNVFSPHDPRIPRILPRQAHDIGCVPGEHQQQQQGASNRIRGRGRCLTAPDSELTMSNSRHTLPDTIRGHHRIEILGSLSLSLSLFSLSLSLYNRFDDCAQASPSWAENEASSSYEQELESLIQARTGKKEALPELVNVPNEKVRKRAAGVWGACMVDREV